MIIFAREQTVTHQLRVNQQEIFQTSQSSCLSIELNKQTNATQSEASRPNNYLRFFLVLSFDQKTETERERENDTTTNCFI